MTPDPTSPLTRRTLLAATALAGVGALAVPVAAQPPKDVQPTKPDTTIVVRKISDMQRTLGLIERSLQTTECGQVCGTVQEHLFLRIALTGEAKSAAGERVWETATAKLTQVKDIVEGDIALLESVEDRGSVGDVLGLERALLNQTVTALGVMPGDNVS